jgi:hypothetical protein
MSREVLVGLVREVYQRFAEEAKKDNIRRVEHSIVGLLFLELRHHYSDLSVRESFGRHAPLKPRQRSGWRRESFIMAYAREGRPPKKTFARKMAQINARLIAKGMHERLIGSGTPDPDLMHDYLKKTLKVKKNRDSLDHWCAYYRSKSEGG